VARPQTPRELFSQKWNRPAFEPAQQSCRAWVFSRRDKMLQGRLISYPDAHRLTALGVNYDSLPVNKRSAHTRTYPSRWQDALRRQTGGPFGELRAETAFGGPTQDKRYCGGVARPVSGTVGSTRSPQRQRLLHASRANLFRFNCQPMPRKRLISKHRGQPGATACRRRIQELASPALLQRADPAYGGRCPRKGLGLDCERDPARKEIQSRPTN